VLGLKREFVGIWGSEFMRMWEGSVKCLDWDMLEWIHEEKKFIGVSEYCDVCEGILNYFKGVKCYFTNLLLPIKKINNQMSFFLFKNK